MKVSRRSFVAGTAAGALLPSPAPAGSAVGSVIGPLAPFATEFLRARNAPGMIVGVTDRSGWSETASYGYADVDARRPIRPDERFHIGSISKSFAALMILQLVAENKVALDADVTRYLPDLRLRTPFGPVTVHHLLCHSSGLQSEMPAPGWPDQGVEQAFAPGARFHYSNMGYAWLGRIVVARGGEDWARALHRRVLDPLGMIETSALIGAAMRRWEVPSYVRREDDRPFPRNGAMTRAGSLNFTAASGCIASTARDMTRYIAMIARRGEGPRGPLLPPELFALMTRRHIAAAEFGPDGGYGYGYGWMTDDVDGRPVIRHTGGMNSFMSSIHVDLAAGVGAFASINAQQNYRPVPVTRQAVRLYRAHGAGSAAAKPGVDPDADPAVGDYVGDYRSEGGAIRVATAGKRLSLIVDGGSYGLESLGDDKFVCLEPRFRLFTFLFRRATPPAEAAQNERNPVLALDWGKDHFARVGAPRTTYPEPDRVPLAPAALGSYEGLYVAEGGWLTAVRVVVRDRRLWVDSFDGVTPLASLGGDRFRFADERANPEVAAFSDASISPRTLSIAGAVMIRVGEAFDILA